MFSGCDTLGQMWDEAARIHSESDCMGTREVIESHMEPQPNGRKFQKLVLGEYHWMDYAEVDEHINDVRFILITSMLLQTHIENFVGGQCTHHNWVEEGAACCDIRRDPDGVDGVGNCLFQMRLPCCHGISLKLPYTVREQGSNWSTEFLGLPDPRRRVYQGASQKFNRVSSPIIANFEHSACTNGL